MGGVSQIGIPYGSVGKGVDGDDLLPFGPGLCGCDAGLLVDGVELGVVGEEHVATLGFRDGGNVFVPVESV